MYSKIYKRTFKSFCYQNPKIEQINPTSFTTKLKYFSLIGLGVAFTFHSFFLQKYNKYSFSHKPYFINTYLNTKLSDFISKKLRKSLSKSSFIHDEKYQLFTESVILSIFSNKEIKEQIDELYPHIRKNIKVHILKSSGIGCILFQNGDLYMSSFLLDMCKNDKNKLKLILSCEIANLLLGNGTYRDYLMIYYELICSKEKYAFNFLSDLNFNNSTIRLFDQTSELQTNISISQMQRLNKYMLFYPENQYITEQHELYKIIKLGLLLCLKEKDFDLSSALKIISDFDEKMVFYDQTYFAKERGNKNTKIINIFTNVIDSI